LKYIWLIPLVPAAGAALNGLLGIRWFGRALAGALACSAMAVALGLSIWAFVGLIALPPDARVHDAVLGTWIPAIPLETATGIGMFSVSWTARLDPLAAIMLLVVTGVAFLIHVYATAYMKDEPRGGYARFFCYLNLFCFFMLVLVLAGNFPVLFVGWEGVGLCSYLLIGFWYEKSSAADAGKKAFIVNRIGDWGFLLGIFLVFFTFGTLDFREIATAVTAMPRESTGFGVLSAICVLLFAGAAGKSAQIPLHVWLPDAMEGPIPASALIHAATMVTAGVYMVARNAVLFDHAPLVMQIVAIIGVLTALMAATIGLVQNDIKRVLAYSTVSQLGYMFLATGVGAFAAAVFHVMTHAFFKALLFLGCGSVIHAMAGEQDMQRMGGLRKYMPVTFSTMLIGACAMAGIPPLSGFFSKDEILYRAFIGSRILWGIATATALLTAFYMFRLMTLTFYGSYRGPQWSRLASPAATAEAAVHGARHPHDAHAHGEADRENHEVTHGAADVLREDHGRHGPHDGSSAITGPLMALAVGVIVAGFFGIPQALGGTDAIEHFLAPSFDGSATVRAGHADVTLSRVAALGLMLFSTLVSVAGILFARHFYLRNPELPRQLAARWHGAYAMLQNKYYLDELYLATVVRGTIAAARGVFAFDRRVVDGAVDAIRWITQMASWFSHMFDKHVVDGVVNLVGWMAGRGSFLVRMLQTGLIQNYALVIVLGLFAFLTVFLFAR
jgi:NADH-quinone oxidoreductase subunit L